MGEISGRVESTGSCEINLRSRRLGLGRRLKGFVACCTCAHRILVILRAVRVLKQMVVLLGKYEVVKYSLFFARLVVMLSSVEKLLAVYAQKVAGFPRHVDGETTWRAFEITNASGQRNIRWDVYFKRASYATALSPRVFHVAGFLCFAFAGVRGGDERDVGVGDGALR